MRNAEAGAQIMRHDTTPTQSPMTRRAVLTAGLGTLTAALILPLGAGPAGAQTAAQISYMRPDEAHKAAQAGDIILIDIRRPEEWLETGVAEGAIGLDMTQDSFVTSLIALRKANPTTPLAVICRTGNRTGHVTRTLAGQGFPGLVDVSEGMVGGRNGKGWLKRELPTYAGTLKNVQTRTRAALP